MGSIRRAAGLLALSQPALSLRIQRLEAELGYPLFDRIARGVRLTERGSRFLPHVKRLLASSVETTEAGRLIGRGAFDRLAIGLTPLAALSFVPDALRGFLAAHDGVHVALTEGLSDELEEAVAHRELDFAIVHPPSPRDDLVTREIAREPFVAAVPVGHRLAERESLCAADFAGERIVSVRRDVGQVSFDRALGYFRRGGASVHVEQAATTSISLVGLVAAGVGIGLVVASVMCIRRAGVRYVPLNDDPPTLGYSLCHRTDLPDELRVAFVQALLDDTAGRTAAAPDRGSLPATSRPSRRRQRRACGPRRTCRCSGPRR